MKYVDISKKFLMQFLQALSTIYMSNSPISPVLFQSIFKATRNSFHFLKCIGCSWWNPHKCIHLCCRSACFTGSERWHYTELPCSMLIRFLVSLHHHRIWRLCSWCNYVSTCTSLGFCNSTREILYHRCRICNLWHTHSSISWCSLSFGRVGPSRCKVSIVYSTI